MNDVWERLKGHFTNFTYEAPFTFHARCMSQSCILFLFTLMSKPVSNYNVKENYYTSKPSFKVWNLYRDWNWLLLCLKWADSCLELIVSQFFTVLRCLVSHLNNYVSYYHFPSLSAWAVFWLPAPPALHHQPLVVLLALGWRCHQALGCPPCPQLYHRQGMPLGNSWSWRAHCPTQALLTSVIASAKVNNNLTKSPDPQKTAGATWNNSNHCKASPYLSIEVFPMQMEGVRLVVNKGLSNYFQVSWVYFTQMTSESCTFKKCWHVLHVSLVFFLL